MIQNKNTLSFNRSGSEGAQGLRTAVTSRGITKGHVSDIYSSDSVVEDKYQRLLQENRQLKIERNDLEEKLKDLKTKFRQLARDLKPVQGANNNNNRGINNISNSLCRTAASSHNVSLQQHQQQQHSSLPPQHTPYGSWTAEEIEALRQQVNTLEKDKRHLEDRLRVSQAQVEYNLRMVAGSNSSSSPSAPHQSQEILILQQKLNASNVAHHSDQCHIDILKKECDALRNEIHVLQEKLSKASMNADGSAALGLQSTLAAAIIAPAAEQHYRNQIQELLQDLQRNRDQQLNDLYTIETLSKERDQLSLRVRMAENTAAIHGNNTYTDTAGNIIDNMNPSSVTDLHRALAEKTTQVTVLTNRMNLSHSHVETLKNECEKLVEELRNINKQLAEVKQNMFSLEREKSTMQLKCERVNDLESRLEHKSSEVVKCEQELLRLIDRLQSCNRDTELQVRRETADRVSEIENMRDKAEEGRRAGERELLALRLKYSDMERKYDNAIHDTELYKREAQRLEAEKKELMDRVALGGGLAPNIDDEVHRAVALAAIKRRDERYSNNNRDGSGVVNREGKEILAMWEGVQWNDEWELTKMRETISSNTLDMELAEQRCSQMQQAILDKNELLEKISGERDLLLEENIELRYRISGVQTALARQQMRKFQDTRDSMLLHEQTGITIIIDRISCDSVFQKCDDGDIYTPTLFFTIDGLEGYEPVISENFFSLDQTLNSKFVFENVIALPSADGATCTDYTMSELQKTNFLIQLHQSFGTKSVIVAAASLQGGRLMHCRFDGVFSDTITLLTTQGEKMGDISVTVEAPGLLLPLILARPLVSALQPNAITAALVSFRAVRALRVQVFCAKGLSCGSHTSSSDTPYVPSPYVYYTATSPHGVTFVSDTVVNSSNRTATTDPVFEVLPVDHRVVLDPEFVRFIHDGSLSFIVFDHRAKDVQENLGIVVVPLKALLESPTTTLTLEGKLHPQGTLEIGMSWVRAHE